MNYSKLKISGFTFLVLLNIAVKAQWSEVGSLEATDYINAVCVTKNGTVLAAGNIKNNSNNYYVAAWNGSSWKELGGDNSLQANGLVFSMVADANNHVFVGGLFQEGNEYVIAEWNGSAWSIPGLKGFNGYIRTMATDTAGNLFAAGSFKDSTGNYYVAKWNGSAWSNIGGLNPNGEFKSLAVDKSGNVFAAGFFTNSANKYYVAKWDGTAWSELGTLNANDYINTLAADTLGNVYAAGMFKNTSGSYYVAKFDGNSWSELGAFNASTSNAFFDLHINKQNQLFAAGAFLNASGKGYVAMWNGSSWSELGGNNSLAANDNIFSVVSDDDGNIYAGGAFKNASNFIYVAKHTQAASSVADIEKHFVKVYPNPFNEWFNLSRTDSFDETNTIEVLDVTGRQVYAQPVFLLDAAIQTESWSQGVYFLNLKSNQGKLQQTIRLIKSN